jgi:hypothetical protein
VVAAIQEVGIARDSSKDSTDDPDDVLYALVGRRLEEVVQAGAVVLADLS